MNKTYELNELILCDTPDAWLEKAACPENLATLLCDHASLERRAAQSAMTVMNRYAHMKPVAVDSSSAGSNDNNAASTALGPLTRNNDRPELLQKLSRLAREELRHFEQVLALMTVRNIPYVQLSPSRYAGALHKLVRPQEPQRLLDTLLTGAFIEARSYERFKKLAPLLDAELQAFYKSLLKSEKRHFQDYLQLAEKYSGKDFSDRITSIAEYEAELISSDDPEFRFHSGLPLSVTDRLA